MYFMINKNIIMTNQKQQCALWASVISHYESRFCIDSTNPAFNNMHSKHRMVNSNRAPKNFQLTLDD